MFKKKAKILTILLTLLLSMPINVYALANEDKKSSDFTLSFETLKEEKNENENINAIGDIGIAHIDGFASNEGGYCKVVFMNLERLDPVDSITGTIRLGNKGTIVGGQKVNEKQLVYGVARVINIYPMGGNFDKMYYNLTITEDGISFPSSGEIALPYIK